MPTTIHHYREREKVKSTGQSGLKMENRACIFLRKIKSCEFAIPRRGGLRFLFSSSWIQSKSICVRTLLQNPWTRNQWHCAGSRPNTSSSTGIIVQDQNYQALFVLETPPRCGPGVACQTCRSHRLFPIIRRLSPSTRRNTLSLFRFHLLR